MKIIKIGGLALSTKTKTLHIIEMLKKIDENCLVIVSAKGRKGFPYATDTLIASLEENKLSLKEYDRLLSIGEIYSSLLFSNEMNRNGLNSYALSYLELGLVCSPDYTNGKVKMVNDSFIMKFKENYKYLIIPGFIGTTEDSNVITMGRGTSDLSSILICNMVKEKKVTMFKDVDGIYPLMMFNLARVKCHEKLSYDEAIALSAIGFNIINLEALKEAKNTMIEIDIVNYETGKLGTIISSEACNDTFLGVNFAHNDVKIASLNPKMIEAFLSPILKQNHIFIKDNQCFENCYFFKVPSSQLLLIRQIIIHSYLKRFIF